ncbi:MAG: hypothetical protein RMJ19_07025 [Gemmatales bacterium]|nr:hypothetical protein [Gemmatales bacterium]MDW8175406.1 hypothetical protein [Gemmatales bacterium]
MLEPKKFVDPLPVNNGQKSQLILELRVTGCVLAPPSVRPSGEQLVWREPLQEARVVNPVAIQELATDIALAALFGRHWPGQGSRHDAYLLLAGALLSSGLTKERVAWIFRGICAVTGDTEIADRLRAIETTEQKSERANGLADGARLADLLTKES